MLRVTAGHDIEYPLRGAGTAVGYYLQDGLEPPGVWAGKAAEAMGLTGTVDPETYRALFGKLIAPTGERLYSGRPPRYVTGTDGGKDGEAEAAVAALDEFATPAEKRRTRAKVLGSTGAAVPFYDLTFSATKSVSLLQASYAAAAAKARSRDDTATADELEAKVKAIDDPPAGAQRLAQWEELSRSARVQILSDLRTAVDEYGACHAPSAELTRAQAERTIRIAVDQVQARHAAFSASALLWELHRALPPLPAGTDPLPVLEELAADALTGQVEGVDIVLVSPAPGRIDVDHLGVRASDGQSVYTAPCRLRYATTAQLDAEQHIIAVAAEVRPRLVHPEHAEAAAHEATAEGQLSGAQAAALTYLLASGQTVTVVRAAAGTGKTRLVGTFARAWTQAAGGAVHVVTVSENAARVAAAEMDAAGAEVRAANLARFLGKKPDGTLGRHTELSARDVIVLDEASQVSTADWLHLTDAAARAGARITAVGDEYQLGAIGAGGVFSLLAERHGATELHEVHRFANEWESRLPSPCAPGTLFSAGPGRGPG